MSAARTSLIGLDREGLKTALLAAGVPAKAVAMRVSQSNLTLNTTMASRSHSPMAHRAERGEDNPVTGCVISARCISRPAP